MSERISRPRNPIQASPPPVQSELRPPTIPPEVWAKLRAEAAELKSQNFKNREELLAWLQARGYEDSEKILQRLRAGGEI